MGIDIRAGGRYIGHKNRTETKSENVYLRLLVKLYRFLARRTDSKFNQVVLKRMYMSRVNRPPMSVSRCARNMKGKEGKICVVVGTITDDARMVKVPALRICALRFTEGARARIVQAGGECLTFDQLAMEAPTGSNCVLLRGPLKARKAYRYFGTASAMGLTPRATGTCNSSTRPYTSGKGRKIERPVHLGQGPQDRAGSRSPCKQGVQELSLCINLGRLWGGWWCLQ